MYQESLEHGALPPSLNIVVITLLLKPGKSPTDCGSYRPISLLNNDLKIICKETRNTFAKLVHIEYLINHMKNVILMIMHFCH